MAAPPQPYLGDATTVDVGVPGAVSGAGPGGVPGAASDSSYAAVMARRVRAGFIRKVFGILSVQLLVTFAIVCIFSFVDGIRDGVRQRPGVLWAALAISVTCLIALSCCPGVAKTYPGNYICLGIFTLAEAYLLGAIGASYAPESVAWAVGATLVLCLALAVFAWQTRIDFTLFSGTLFVVLLAFVLFGIWAAAFRSMILQTIYAA